MPDEPGADAELPLPPRPAAEVLVPPRSAGELRSELQRLEGEHERGLQELGALVAEMAHRGALAPALLADRAAVLRSRQDQIDALTRALGSKAHSPFAPNGTRRATLLTALLAVAVLGAVAGAWIEHRHDDTTTASPPAPVVVTQTIATTVQAAVIRPVTTRSHLLAARARGGRAVARRP